MMGQAGPMSHADTVDNLTLFAKEVLPRLKEYKQPRAEARAAIHRRPAGSVAWRSLPRLAG